MDSHNLANNESFLVISSYGNAFRTRIEKDFLIVSTWRYLVFSGKVKSNHYLFMKLGSVTEIKVLINKIPMARAFDDIGHYEIAEVTEHIAAGQTIKDCWTAEKTRESKRGHSKSPKLPNNQGIGELDDQGELYHG